VKVSEFNCFVPSLIDGTVLAYNTFSGSFLSLSAEEFDVGGEWLMSLREKEDETALSPEDRWIAEKFIEGGFVVDDEVNERGRVKQRYFQGKESSAGLGLTIAPTINCNFGCTYCFQEHPKKMMSDENVRSIQSYVDKELKPNTSLHITWFGGEPLMAFTIIKQLSGFFTEVCAERDCRYTQSMITNGSLLNKEKIDYIESQGNYKYLQITLDGPPKTHDKRRLYTGGQSSFERILGNIVKAKGRVPISVRVNIDKRNYQDIPDLVSILVENDLLNYVSLYLGRVVHYTDVCGDEVNDVTLSVEEFADIESKLEFSLLERGERPSASLPKPRVGHLCGADNPNANLFSPDNLVFKCWNEAADLGENASGLLKDGEIRVKLNHSQTRNSWDTYDPFQHGPCETCLVQPLCNGGCPWEARKQPKHDPGFCTSLKYSLPDKLRMYHLMTTIDDYSLDDGCSDVPRFSEMMADGCEQ